MKLNKFFLISVFVYVPFGIAMILLPVTLFGWYGFDLTGDGAILGQVVGAAIIGLGSINFHLSRKSHEKSNPNAVILGNLYYHLLDLCIMLPPILNSDLNLMAWSFVIIHLFFVVGFAYFLKISKTSKELKC